MGQEELQAASEVAAEVAAEVLYTEQLDTIITLLSYILVCLIVLVAVCGIVTIIKTYNDMWRSI